MISDDVLLEYTRAHADDLTTLRRLERAAVAHVEEKTGYQWRGEGDVIETVIRRGNIVPLSAVPTDGVLDLLESWDGTGWTPVDSTAYYVDGSHVTLQSFPASVSPYPQRFRVTYPAGYPSESEPSPADSEGIEVPENVTQGALMYVTYWYDNRDGLDWEQLEQAVSALLRPMTRQTV